MTWRIRIVSFNDSSNGMSRVAQLVRSVVAPALHGGIAAPSEATRRGFVGVLAEAIRALAAARAAVPPPPVPLIAPPSVPAALVAPGIAGAGGGLAAGDAALAAAAESPAALTALRFVAPCAGSLFIACQGVTAERGGGHISTCRGGRRRGTRCWRDHPPQAPWHALKEQLGSRSKERRVPRLSPAGSRRSPTHCTQTSSRSRATPTRRSTSSTTRRICRSVAVLVPTPVH